MDHSKGFKRQGKYKICKFLKSLYGLKQASRQWNIKLTDVLQEANYIKVHMVILCSPEKKRKYTPELISNVGLSGTRPMNTPLEVNSKLTTMDYDEHVGGIKDPLLRDITSYQKLIGMLLYLSITRADISFVVQVLGQFMQKPKVSHWEGSIRFVRYCHDPNFPL
ncbi:uncharacterized mitochondrial protein AtMg00810-like [Nicotiana sylvestris]|uniref:uncharacterized mitochondrial protein AtMg00810-like n=1 Tax=Nicotiana sylvestris TaxID=4096 RepID=UPI00388CB8BC